MPTLRVFVLPWSTPSARVRVWARWSSQEAGIPQMTTAAQWADKPEYCVNIAITYEGLEALQVPAASLQTFPSEFAVGAVARANQVGDSGPSAPSTWKGGLADPRRAHPPAAVRPKRGIARAGDSNTGARSFAETGSSERFCQDGDALPGNLAHFGYRDGFPQPTIEGGLPGLVPDRLPPAPAGEFVLGHPSQFQDFTYPVPQPDDLGRNGSFVALADSRAGLRGLRALPRGGAGSLWNLGRAPRGEALRALAQRRAAFALARYGHARVRRSRPNS